MFGKIFYIIDYNDFITHILSNTMDYISIMKFL